MTSFSFVASISWPTLPYQDIRYLVATPLNFKLNYNVQDDSDRKKAIVTSLVLYSLSFVGSYFTTVFCLSKLFTAIPLTIKGLSIAFSSFITFKIVQKNDSKQIFSDYEENLGIFCRELEYVIYHDWILSDPERTRKHIEEHPLPGEVDRLIRRELDHTLQIDVMQKIIDGRYQERSKIFMRKGYLSYIKKAVDTLLQAEYPEIYSERASLKTYQMLQDV